MELNGNVNFEMKEDSDATVFMRKCIEEERVDVLQSILAQVGTSQRCVKLLASA